MTFNQNFLQRLVKYLPYVLLFLFTFFYFSFFAPYIFYYQEKSSLFVLSLDYLKENLQQPGGMLVYISTFLTTFGYYHVAGAFISASLLLLFIILSEEIVRKITGKDAGPFPWLIALILFFLQCDYQYMLVNNVGLLLQLILFLLIIKKPGGWLPVILIPFWYYFTGGFALVFAIMYIIWQVMERPGKFLFRTGVFLIAGLITYYISSEFLFFQGSKELLSFPWSPGGTGYQTTIFIAGVTSVCILPLVAELRKLNLLKIKIPENNLIYNLARTGALIALMFVTGIIKYDKKTLDYFRAEKMFVENKYQELISFNLKNPSNNKLTIYLNNIALCETGRLNDLLFHFHQSLDGGGTLFLKWEIVDEIIRRGGYFYYCTGMINEAQRWAFEYMVMKGLTPEGLKMMIKTELINGNYKTAARYNDILRKTIFYRKESIRFDKLLFNDAAIDTDPELGQKRKIRVHRDFFSITNDPFINVERVVATDSLNRQVFDYMMAWLLINKDYKGIADGWKNLARYNFRSIPVHIEEAGVALRTLYATELPATGNINISSATENRFAKFLQTFQAYGSNLQAAEPALKKQFGDTFWYYVFYK